MPIYFLWIFKLLEKSLDALQAVRGPEEDGFHVGGSTEALNSKMSSFKQTKAGTDKAAAGISALTRLMANVEGPTFTRRQS